MKTKLGKQKVTVLEKGQAKPAIFTAFEDANYLESFVQFNLKGRQAGAAILQRTDKRFCFVFGFRAQGFHNTLRSEQINPTLNAIEASLKEIPSGERLTLHLTSFTEDADRQAELDELIQTAPCAELQLLLMSEKARVQELKVAGNRQPKSLYLYATYCIDHSETTPANADYLEKLIAKGERWWRGFKGTEATTATTQLQEMLTRTFSEGYLRWEQLLSLKMGLNLQPLNAQELWGVLWQRFNQESAPKIPQLLRFEEDGLTEVVHNDLHPLTVLVQGEKGKSRVPQSERRWIQVKDKYVGALALANKPAGFTNASAQLRYLWETLCRPQVKDTEIICQVTSCNSLAVKTKMQRLTKQNNVTAYLASEKLNVDVAAQLKTKRSVQTQERIYEGAEPLNIATVFLVHRDSKSQLDEACAALSEHFQLPAKLIREVDLTWQFWLQTLPISWDNLLAKPFNRRLTYLTNEAPGFLPLTLTRQGSTAGFELIADEGSAPVRINFVKEHRNIAAFGTTRSGKSVLISGMLTQALAQGLPVVALDYPKPDGTSTFSDYTQFLAPRGAYFDIGKQSNNLMEIPDLRHLGEEERKERFEDYKSFLESALVTMVLPSSQGSLLEQTVRSLIGQALINFFNDSQINQRYTDALSEGFGSTAWNHTPTLKDFLAFCSELDLEKLGGTTGLLKDAQSQIVLQLNYWLNSRVGKAIGQPSSFPTDAQLLVFALRNLSNQNEAAILALSAYSAALRRALASPASIFFVDESPILFKFREISLLIGRLCANGAKAGIRVFLSGQDPDSIMNSEAGQQIMQNINTRLIGRIQPLAIESFVRLLHYDRTIVAKNASESFFPKRSELYSNWLLDMDGLYTYCRYYPSALQLATVANNPDEQAARSHILAQYPQQKLKGIATFAHHYVRAIRSGGSLQQIIQDTP